MPGFNQRGPMNQGPMTGRSQGTCTGNQSPGMGSGMGMGRRRGRRCVSQGFQSPHQRAGFGRFNEPEPMTDSRELLKNREAALEQELAALKQQIRNLSEPDE
ncbi:MAG: hypothetical protein D3926_14205 [Desulfobacteraceae bacterium]|nr:MAG: hypothetical protein D3926_14205 [Desulfobacteraceae bacterium]